MCWSCSKAYGITTSITEETNFANFKGKTGRSTGMDECVKLNLHDVMEGKKFGDVFSKSEFPREKKTAASPASCTRLKNTS
jgi:hypothetical protein